MNHDRRDFLKMFGVGCTVVPIIGGIPVAAAESKLVEIPKIEPVENLSMLGDLRSSVLMSGPMGITVIMDDPLTGKRTTLQGKTFVMSVSDEMSELKNIRGDIRGLVHRYKKTTWRMEGEFIGNEKNELGTITQEFIR
jgi:hypothetical protein